MEDTIDPEFMPQVQDIDAESILRRMDIQAAEQAYRNRRVNAVMEQMREEQDNCEETKQNIQTFLDDYDRVISDGTVKFKRGIISHTFAGNLGGLR